MNRTLPALLLLTFILGACTQNLSVTEIIPASPQKTPLAVIETSTLSILPTQTSTIAPSPTATLNPSPTSTFVFIHLDQSIVDMPTATAPYKQCGSAGTQRVFALAYIVYDAIKLLDPIADGFAETIDVECVDLNGNRFTYAAAIYFYIDNRFAENLNDYEALGSWIVSVMNLLDTIPRDEFTMYAEPTTTVFTYYTSNSDSLKVIVRIQDYWAKADGKSGEEVFEMFYTEP